MAELKLLQICSYYMGSGIYKNLFKELEDSEIDENILYYASNESNLSDVPENFIISQPYKRYDRLIFSIKHNKVYKDVVTKVNSDFNLSHAHSLISNGYIAYNLKKAYNIPYIVAVRNTDLFVFFRYLIHIRPLGVKILKNAEKVIFISPKYKEITLNKFVPLQIREQIEKKSVVIPNGIDDYYLNNTFKGRKSIDDVIKLIYVGRVDDLNKNIRKLIKACDILISKNKKIELTLVGSLKRNWFKKLYLEKSYIRHIPQTDKEGVRKELMNSHIFVMPSKRETFGLVYVEAMSQGLPVIYTENQGFDGQFEEGEVGYHIKSHDAKDIANKILMVVDNYDEISSRVVERSLKFNWKDISKKYIQIYNECMRK